MQRTILKKQVQVRPYQARKGCREDFDSSTISMPWTLHAFRKRRYIAQIAAHAIRVPVVLIPERKSKTLTCQNISHGPGDTSLEDTLTDMKAREAGKLAT